MKRLMKKLEDIMVAITFAEAGEYDIAIETIGDKGTSAEEIRDLEADAKQTVVEPA